MAVVAGPSVTLEARALLENRGWGVAGCKGSGRCVPGAAAAGSVPAPAAAEELEKGAKAAERTLVRWCTRWSYLRSPPAPTSGPALETDSEALGPRATPLRWVPQDRAWPRPAAWRWAPSPPQHPRPAPAFSRHGSIWEVAGTQRQRLRASPLGGGDRGGLGTLPELAD